MTADLPRRLGAAAPFAVYPAGAIVLLVLHLWVASGISPFAAVRGLVVALVVGIALSALGTAILRDRHRGGLLGLLMVLLVVAGGRPGVAPILLLPAILLVIDRYGPRHTSLDWAWVGKLVGRVTVILAIAVLLEAIQFGRFGDLVAAVQGETPMRSGPVKPPPADAPDVYVILLDGYARADVLSERFGLDISPFLDGLGTRGFDVATDSHSNYIVTNLSLSSFLNFRHLADIAALKPLIDDPGATEGPHVHRAISQAAVLTEFRSLGYQTVGISSGFEQAAVRSADAFVDNGELNEFEIQLLRPAVIPPLLTAAVPDAFSANQRQRIESVFEAVETLAAQPSSRPRFVFAHVPSPHGPWVSRADGSPRVVMSLETWYFDTPETTGLGRAEVVKGYVDQTVYLDGRVLRAVETILAKSTRPPVILVVSDHGSSLDVGNANVESRLRILFAAHTPGHEALFADDVSLVGVFPTLFDAYYGVQLPRPAETLYTGGPRGLWDPVAVNQ